MSDLQHQRIVELCQELRLSAMPNLYSGIAQSAAAKAASFADFLEAVSYTHLTLPTKAEV